MAATRTILVAGAGIGGLTAALALAARNFRVLLLERAEQLEEVGAGLQLSPNASRILLDLGVGPALAPTMLTPDAISVMAAPSGNKILDIPVGRNAEFRYGAPYWIVHRADLQNALLQTVRAHPDIELRLGVQVEDVAQHAHGVTVVARRGVTRTQERGLALIGADGVWSAVRNQIFPNERPQFTGRIAWRGTIDPEALPRAFGAAHVQLWLGPNAHLVVYPISAGRRINVVAVSAGTWNRPGWSEPGDRAAVNAIFGYPTWPGAARMLIGAVEEWKRWALFGLADGGAWNNGAVALLGDAAHAMLPFVAQGAGMAIEDAAVVAKCLAEQPDNVPAALATYAAQRRGRVGRVQRTARQTGEIYHMTGPAAFARNLAMRVMGGARLFARHDWIYDWRLG